MVSNNELNLDGPSDMQVAIDDSLFAHRSSIEEQIEKVLLWAHNEIGSEQLVAAKEQFYWKTGKFFSDDLFYVNRISYFVDAFIFERPLETSSKFSGKTPFESFKENNQTSIQEFIHSIFCVHKVSDDYLILKDLIDTKVRHKISLRESESFDGILKNDIFQGYIYKIEDKFWMSRGLIFHPYQAYRLIKKSIKKHQKQKESQLGLILNQFARQQLKHKRHDHVNPKIFYAEESK